MKNILGLMATILVIFSLSATGAMAADRETHGNVVLYKQVPSAYELAKAMFPPKTRSVVLNGDASSQPAGKKVAFLINFEYDSVVVRPESQHYLDSLGDMLNFDALKDKSLTIEGYADASGSDDYNLSLSEKRAEAIKEYLVSVHRVAPDRLNTEGYGKTRPLDNADPYAAINRRAEFRPGEAQ